MTAMDRSELATVAVKQPEPSCLGLVDEPNCGDGEERRSPEPLPWIGALTNPQLGPMVVVNDGGYLVPLFTAADLVRICRRFWQRSQGRE